MDAGGAGGDVDGAGQRFRPARALATIAHGRRGWSVRVAGGVGGELPGRSLRRGRAGGVVDDALEADLVVRIVDDAEVADWCP